MKFIKEGKNTCLIIAFPIKLEVTFPVAFYVKSCCQTLGLL